MRNRYPFIPFTPYLSASISGVKNRVGGSDTRSLSSNSIYCGSITSSRGRSRIVDRTINSNFSLLPVFSIADQYTDKFLVILALPAMKTGHVYWLLSLKSQILHEMTTKDPKQWAQDAAGASFLESRSSPKREHETRPARTPF